MKILILGAGQVGGTLAENLANEANDITVIDTWTSGPSRARRPIRPYSGRPAPKTVTW